MFFTLKWMIDLQDDGKLLKEFLKEKEISRTALTDIKFRGGNILVNGVQETVRYRLKKGDILVVIFPKEESSETMMAENIPLKIVYEDDYVLVIDKPASMSTIPSREHPSGSLANALLYYYKTQGLNTTIHIVTRLDRDTSGLVLVAKHRHVHHLLAKQQQAKEIKRQYQAIVHGHLEKDKDRIDVPIGRKCDSIIEREVRSDGQHAVTHFEVVKRYDLYTHVSLHLETGRTHQIRVHLSFLGHPLVGDDLYGGSRDLISRQALHSYQLRFFHPFLNREIILTSPLPCDMEELLNQLANE